MRQEILVTRCSIKNKRGPGLRHCQQITQSKYLPKTDEKFPGHGPSKLTPGQKAKVQAKNFALQFAAPIREIRVGKWGWRRIRDLLLSAVFSRKFA